MSSSSAAEQSGYLEARGEQDLPAAVAQLWERARQRGGYVPALVQSLSLRPAHLLAWMAYFEALGADVPDAERELIAVVVSALNRCDHGVAAHAAALREQLDDPQLVHRLSHNPLQAELPAREAALVRFAARVTSRPDSCRREHADELRAHGFSDEEIHDAAEFIAFMNLVNRLALALGWPVDLQRLPR
jgi:uncharacterized peroxidase-related enzyme